MGASTCGGPKLEGWWRNEQSAAKGPALLVVRAPSTGMNLDSPPQERNIIPCYLYQKYGIEEAQWRLSSGGLYEREVVGIVRYKRVVPAIDV